MGETAKAVALLEAAVRDKAQYQIEGAYLWLRIADRLAQVYRDIGRHHDAERLETELRGQLAVADDDHPIKRRLQ